jgi:hypothetical protein
MITANINNENSIEEVESKNKREQWMQKVMGAHIPTYFKIKTLNASAGRIFEPSLPKTIRYSYNALGYDLGSCVFQHTDEEAFDQLLDVWDDEIKTAKWLRRHMNHFFRLIPSRKRSLFVEGFQEGFEERGCLG